MKFIPGSCFINKTKKNTKLFEPGVLYTLRNIKFVEQKVIYTFTVKTTTSQVTFESIKQADEWLSIIAI